MPQGKEKLRRRNNKLPSGAIIKLDKRKRKAAAKPTAKRPNAPVKSKKAAVEKSKMKATVTKMVNAAAEKELRSLSKNTPQLSAAQKRVAAAPTAPAVAKK